MKTASKTETPLPRGKMAPHLDLNVTKECIAEGVAADSQHCAIARAILRKFPRAIYIRCDMREVAFTDLKTRTRRRYFNSAFGAKQVLAFDKGDMANLQPFRLQLTNGIETPMGWKPKHPNSTRPVVRRPNARGKTKAKARFARTRTFGACAIEENRV